MCGRAGPGRCSPLVEPQPTVIQWLHIPPGIVGGNCFAFLEGCRVVVHRHGVCARFTHLSTAEEANAGRIPYWATYGWRIVASGATIASQE